VSGGKNPSKILNQKNNVSLETKIYCSGEKKRYY